MFDPETLRTFIAVAETGSFSKAAERLCKTTATISYRIKLLEENTGVALFFRTTRSVTLTAAGEHLLSQARDWLSVDSNRRGNPLTVMGRAMDDIGDDMSKSPSNFLRDVVSTGTVVALAPLSALLLIL